MYHRSSRRGAIPQVQPVIAELLRTCLHQPILYLQIERVIRKTVELESDSENERRPGHVIKLLLTDGHLVIQALLHRKLSTLPEIADLSPGDTLEIHKSVVKKSQRTNGPGQAVYLGIDNCYVIKAEEIQRVVDDDVIIGACTTKRKRSDCRMETADDYIDETSGGFLPEDAQDIVEKPRTNGRTDTELEVDVSIESTRALGEAQQPDMTSPQQSTIHTQSGLSDDCTPLKRKASSGSQSDDEQAFETVRVNLTTAKKRRMILHELNQNVLSSPVRPPTGDSTIATSKQHSMTQDDLAVEKAATQFDEAQRDVVSEAGRLSSRGAAQMEPLQSSEAEHRAGSHAISAQKTTSHSIHRSSSLSRPTTPVNSNTFSRGPLHDLASLYSPSLPSKSYVFTTIVIPTYVASHLISRPNSPFPPKRHIKVVDLSLANKLTITKTNVLGRGITVSVYRDAVNFKPTVGKVALMRGVVMQRLNGNAKGTNEKSNGEVILNVYPENSRIHRQSQSQFGSPRQVHFQSQEQHSKKDGQQEETSISHHNVATYDFALDRKKISKPIRSETQLKPDICGTISRPAELPVDTTDEGQWFVDDHQILRDQGYNIDLIQTWWNKLMGIE